MCDTRDFHVSISRTVPIRHHWIEPLKELLQHGFQGKRKCVAFFNFTVLKDDVYLWLLVTRLFDHLVAVSI